MGPLMTRSEESNHLGRGLTRTQFAFAIVFPFLATVFVAARLASRKIKGTPFWWDDWTVVAALISHYVQCGLAIASLFIGRFGYHTGDVVTPREEQLDAKWIIILQYPYAFAMALARASIMLLFFRIFIHAWYRRTTYVTMFLNCAWFVYVIVVSSVGCVPFEKNWNPKLPGHCIDETTQLIIIAIWGIVVDVVIWVLPIPMVWNLQMPRPYKIALTAVFGLGTFDVVVSILRIITIHEINYDDFGYTVANAFLWALAEAPIAIIVSCAPICRPVLDRLLPKNLQKSFKSVTHWHGRSRNARSADSYGRIGESGNHLVKSGNSTKVGGSSVDKLEGGQAYAFELDERSRYGGERRSELPEDGIRVQRDVTVV